MAGFLFRLETVGRRSCGPPKLQSAIPNWKPGDSIYLGSRALRVVRIRTREFGAPP